jgi:hypothetical protein
VLVRALPPTTHLCRHRAVPLAACCGAPLTRLKQEHVDKVTADRTLYKPTPPALASPRATHIPCVRALLALAAVPTTAHAPHPLPIALFLSHVRTYIRGTTTTCPPPHCRFSSSVRPLFCFPYFKHCGPSVPARLMTSPPPCTGPKAPSHRGVARGPTGLPSPSPEPPLIRVASVGIPFFGELPRRTSLVLLFVLRHILDVHLIVQDQAGRPPNLSIDHCCCDVPSPPVSHLPPPLFSLDAN